MTGPDGLVEKATKTHSARRVSLDAGTAAVLADHRERMMHLASVCRVAVAADAFVFSNAADASAPWFPDSVSRSFKRLCEKEGVPDVRLHDLRHFLRHAVAECGGGRPHRGRSPGTPQCRDDVERVRPFVEQPDRNAADVIGGFIAPVDRDE